MLSCPIFYFASLVGSACKFHTGTDIPVVIPLKSVVKRHRTEQVTVLENQSIRFGFRNQYIQTWLIVAFCMGTKASIARILQQYLPWETCFAEILQSWCPTALQEHSTCAWPIAIDEHKLCPKYHHSVLTMYKRPQYTTISAPAGTGCLDYLKVLN